MNPSTPNTAKPERDIDRQNKDAAPKNGADKSTPNKPVSSQPVANKTNGSQHASKAGGDANIETPPPHLKRTDSTAASADNTNLPDAERYNDADTDAIAADDKNVAPVNKSTPANAPSNKGGNGSSPNSAKPSPNSHANKR